MPSDPRADDPDEAVGSFVAEETTRVAATQYLEGASGHAVLSLLFVGGAAILSVRDLFGPAVVAGLIAFGVAGNGLSIYLWDELRRVFATAFRTDEEAPTRTLTPHRISAEMKAELASGALLVGGLCVLLGLTLLGVRILGFERAAPLALGGLAVGNLGALWWTYLRSSPNR